MKEADELRAIAAILMHMSDSEDSIQDEWLALVKLANDIYSVAERLESR